jgi:hypothetical protein
MSESSKPPEVQVQRWAALREETRSSLHLEGELPAGTTELIYRPTFHEFLGVRLRGLEAEVWRSDDVLAVRLERDFAQRIAACAAHLAPEDTGGRDGLVLFARTHGIPREFVSFTTSGKDAGPWLFLAYDVLVAIGGQAPVEALLPYFRSLSPG